MSTPRVQDLESMRRARQNTFLERLNATEATLTELRELHEHLRLVDAALVERKAQGKAKRAPLLVLVVAIAFASLVLGYLRMPSTPFSMDLEASSITLELPPDASLGSQSLSEGIRIEGFSSVESSRRALLAGKPTGTERSMALRAQTLLLQRIRSGGRSVLRMDASAKAARVSLEALTGGVTATIEVIGVAEIQASPGETRTVDTGLGDWIAFGTEPRSGGRAAPLDVVLNRGDQQSFVWTGLRPDSVRFVERQSRGEGEVGLWSSIKSARIRLPARKAEVELRAGDDLELSGLAIERCDITVADDVTVHLSGTAERIESVVGTFSRSLKPSVLEYFASNHAIGLFWSAAGFLWGATVWVRRQFGE
jgi:hypothetical protein